MRHATARDFEVVLDDGVARLIVGCEVDLANIAEFGAHVDDALGRPGASSVVLDLSGCTYLDSIGLHVLFAGAARARETGRHLTVTGADGIVRRLLDVVDVDGQLGVAAG
jgi:anti-anti-sigma factor